MGVGSKFSPSVQNKVPGKVLRDRRLKTSYSPSPHIRHSPSKVPDRVSDRKGPTRGRRSGFWEEVSRVSEHSFGPPGSESSHPYPPGTIDLPRPTGVSRNLVFPTQDPGVWCSESEGWDEGPHDDRTSRVETTLPDPSGSDSLVPPISSFPEPGGRGLLRPGVHPLGCHPRQRVIPTSVTTPTGAVRTEECRVPNRRLNPEPEVRDRREETQES